MRTMRLDHVAACIDWLGLKSVAVTGKDPTTVALVAAWLSSRHLGLSVDERCGAPGVDLIVSCPFEYEAGTVLSQLLVRAIFPGP